MKNKTLQKEFIITYRSREHYEVLGWVKASSLKKAKEKAKKELIEDTTRYHVPEAQIGEYKGIETIVLNIK